MTKMQKNMLEAVNREIEIQFKDGSKPIRGKCVGFTQPLDNDPEVASIEIKVHGYSCLFEITEDQIKTLVIQSFSHF